MRRYFHFTFLLAVATLLAACGGSSTTVAAPSNAATRCAVTVSATATTIGPAGGGGSVTVDTARECQWTATADVPWLSIPSGASGQGPNTIPYTASANPSSASRRGTITVNGERVEIAQEAPACAASLSTRAVTVIAGGGVPRVTLTTPASCTWTAVSRASWIVVTSNGNGAGNTEVVLTVAANAGAARSGVVEIAGQEVTVSQAAATVGCSFAINPSSLTVGAELSSTSVTVAASANCAWAAISEDPWIIVTASSSGIGNGSVALQITANSGPFRIGSVTIAGRTFSITQSAAAAACSYSVAPASRSVAASGGATTVAVATSSACAWSTTGLPAWISATGGNGSGNGTVNLTVQANTGAARAATLTVAGQPFTVDQAAAVVPCTYTLNPPGHSAAAAGGATSVAVVSASGCAWSTTGQPSWISVTGGSGSGNGTVNLTVQANAGAARTATLTIGDQPFTVNQAAPTLPACTYTLNPTSHSATAAGGATSVAVSASSGCSWSTTGLPSWITFTSGNGTGSGNGTVDLTVQANTGAARTATFTIASQSFIVNQAAPTPPACTYALNPTSHSATAAGGPTSVAVSTSSGCTWATTGLPSWITFTIGNGTGSGNGTVDLTVQANTGAARTATFTIAGQSFTVNQAAQTCTYVLNPTSHSPTALGGPTSVAVSTSSACSWATTGLPLWIIFTIGNGTGSGNGTVDLTVQANTGAARTATLTIAGQSFTVSQAAALPACTYTVTPSVFNVDDQEHVGPGALSIVVQTTSQCSWAASVTSGASWLTITTGASGTGNGSTVVDVARNLGAARTGVLTVAGQTVTINQAKN